MFLCGSASAEAAGGTQNGACRSFSNPRGRLAAAITAAGRDADGPTDACDDTVCVTEVAGAHSERQFGRFVRLLRSGATERRPEGATTIVCGSVRLPSECVSLAVSQTCV